MRRAAKVTAELYTWPKIVERALLPRLRLLAGPEISAAQRPPGVSDAMLTEPVDAVPFPGRGVRRRGADAPGLPGPLSAVPVAAGIPIRSTTAGGDRDAA